MYKMKRHRRTTAALAVSIGGVAGIATLIALCHYMWYRLAMTLLEGLRYVP